jgi:hypothetical protein
MTPPAPAPSFSHEEIGPDGAWVVGTFPAGSGVWFVETYNPTDFDHQALTASVEVDATLVAVPFDQVLPVFSPTCAQLDVRPKGGDQPTGGGDLETSGCADLPPVTVPPPTTAPPTTAPPITAPPTPAPPTPSPPAPAAPPVTAPVADSPPDAVTEVPTTEAPYVGAPITVRSGTLPTTGRNTDGLTTLGLTLLAGGGLLTVPRTLRRRWSRAR